MISHGSFGTFRVAPVILPAKSDDHLNFKSHASDGLSADKNSGFKILTAQFDYRDLTSKGLNFKVGDEIKVLQVTHTDWWLGQMANDAGKRGLFSYHYMHGCRHLELLLQERVLSDL